MTMQIVGTFVRDMDSFEGDCDGPYTVFEKEQCPECLCERAVTVRNSSNQIVWFGCLACGVEQDLMNAIRA